MVFSQKSKGNICDVCSHVNKVDQMRCDKCSHIIGRRSYSGSTRNSSKLSTPRKSNHGANQSDEHEAAKGAENDSSVERTTTGVATLFSTAAGKTVSVSESSLRAARMKLGQELCADGSTLTEPPLQESGPGVATLFSTAAGKTVSVSESSLRAARMKLGQELCADDEATVENTAQSESVGVPPPSTPVAGRRAKVSEPPLRSVGEAFPPNDERLLLSGATPAGVTAVAGPNGQSKNVGACLRQLRKPFVVPFAKVAPDTGKAQEAERSSISNTLRAKRRFNDGVTSTKHISFDVCMYRSMPLSSLPSIDDFSMIVFH
ncbi:unnamed protein product [Trypanosoma congolense IL3000]|uniref:WGS project CAEQ00000000 data, annotated contig 1666 n=1 Tax=Trypanosoma congolense (strain IL3000) TaxID=1068625 RepID=F9W7W9_TRYCI|nr:unnamed protein product [Trypanosoma congolense IL3000]